MVNKCIIYKLNSSFLFFTFTLIHHTFRIPFDKIRLSKCKRAKNSHRRCPIIFINLKRFRRIWLHQGNLQVTAPLLPSMSIFNRFDNWKSKAVTGRKQSCILSNIFYGFFCIGKTTT